MCSLKLYKLAKAAKDNSFCLFCTMLAYKQKRSGHTFVKVDKYYPSSQMCHECGCINPITKDLSVRHIICPNCGSKYQRDINATINIDKEGLRIALA